MNSGLQVPGDIHLMDIGYNHNSHKVLGFINTEESGSTDPGYPYSYTLLDTYCNFYILPFVHPCILGSYSNCCNKIDNRTIPKNMT